MRKINLFLTTVLFIFGLSQNVFSQTGSIAEAGTTPNRFDINGIVYISSSMFQNMGITDGDTLYIAGAGDTLKINQTNTTLASLDILLYIVDSGVVHWTGNYDWKLSDSTKLIINTGGDLWSEIPCNANKRFVFGTHNVASCSGGNADYSFRDILDWGGFDPQNPPPPPVPVTLTKFEGKAIDANTVKLDWQTATEVDHEKFELYRSFNAVDFELIHTEYGDGINSNAIKNYTHNDLVYNNDFAYYKLVQTDFDGKSETFNVIYVELEKDIKIQIFPNPTTEILNVSMKSDNLDTKVEIIDNKGSIVYSGLVDASGSLRIDVQSLTTGIYYLKAGNKVQKIYKN